MTNCHTIIDFRPLSCAPPDRPNRQLPAYGNTSKEGERMREDEFHQFARASPAPLLACAWTDACIFCTCIK